MQLIHIKRDRNPDKQLELKTRIWRYVKAGAKSCCHEQRQVSLERTLSEIHMQISFRTWQILQITTSSRAATIALTRAATLRDT
jgi:hypothetical protein